MQTFLEESEIVNEHDREDVNGDGSGLTVGETFMMANLGACAYQPLSLCICVLLD